MNHQFDPELSTVTTAEGCCPTLYFLSMQQCAGSRPIVDFIRTLNVKAVAKFFSKHTQNHRNSSIHLYRLLSAMAKRGKRKTLVRGTRRAFRGGRRRGSSANGRPPPGGRVGVRPRKPISVPADPMKIYPPLLWPP